MLSCEFCEISKNIFFTEHLRATASVNTTMQSYENHISVVAIFLD